MRRSARGSARPRGRRSRGGTRPRGSSTRTWRSTAGCSADDACYTTRGPAARPRDGGDEEPAMPLKKLGHVVLKVRDLDRSEAFYTGVVGLRVTGRMPGRMVFFSV